MTHQPQDVSHRVAQKIALRNKIKEIKEKHKAELAPYLAADEKLDAVLLNHLNTQGIESVKTSNGTFFKTTKNSCSLEDPAQFMRHVIGAEEWDLLDRKANVTAVADFVAQHGEAPPGVKFSTTVEVNVRAPTKK